MDEPKNSVPFFRDVVSKPPCFFVPHAHPHAFLCTKAESQIALLKWETQTLEPAHGLINYGQGRDLLLVVFDFKLIIAEILIGI